jgi:hypothetical protein
MKQVMHNHFYSLINGIRKVQSIETALIQFLSASEVFLLILNRDFNAALTEHMAICCRAWLIQLVHSNWVAKHGFFWWRWWHFHWYRFENRERNLYLEHDRKSGVMDVHNHDSGVTSKANIDPNLVHMDKSYQLFKLS